MGFFRSVVVFAACCVPTLIAGDLTIIGDFAGGVRSSTVLGLSATGDIACGSGTALVDEGLETEEEVIAAFVWTADSGLTMLPFATAAEGRRRAVARAISADGAFIVGESRNVFNKDEAALWTRQSDGSYTVQLLSPPSGSVFRRNVLANLDALAISDDGSVVCGRGQTTPGEFEAWVWTADSGLQPIGNLSNGPIDKPNRRSYSSAEGISGDGQTIVGGSWSGVTESGSVIRQAFAYDLNTGTMTALGDITDPVVSSDATAISGNGDVITGQARDEDNNQVAFRKAGTAAMLSLGDVAGGDLRSEGDALSADGAVIVGSGNTARGTEALIWRSSTQTSELLATVAGITDQITDGYLESAVAVSDDGRVIGGNIIYPSDDNRNERVAYLITLDDAIDLAELAANADLSLTKQAGTLQLGFSPAANEDITYTLSFSPDLVQPFAPQVRFTQGENGLERTVIAASYTGTSLSLDPPLESFPLKSLPEKGFWTLNLSQ